MRGGETKIWRGKPRLKMGSAAGNGAGWGVLSSATASNGKQAGAGKAREVETWQHRAMSICTLCRVSKPHCRFYSAIKPVYFKYLKIGLG